MRFPGLATLAVVALCACGGGGGGGPQAGSIALNAGDNQVAAAGAALPESLAVIVRDNAGAALPGALVTWSVTAGGGSVSPTTRTSDAAGIAKTRRTLGPNAGTQTARATVSGLAPVNFNAVSQIQGAVNIANATTGPLTDTVLASKAESLDVLVTNQNAVPVSGVGVAWASASGSVSSGNVATSATGHSKVRYTYGTAAGAQTATATVAGLVGSPVTITLQATAGTATNIVKTTGDAGTAAPSAQVTYTVTARDANNNPKQGVTIAWAVATGGGSITPAQDTTGVSGTASAQRTLGSGTGDQTATATASGLPGTPQVTFTTTAQLITTVTIADNSFTPSTLTVPLHTTVTWSWTGVNTHNVTFTTAGAPTDISDRTSGDVGRTFDTAGTFQFHCTHHAGMTGSITVNP
ncbi:MAG TPA: plastocyanin/azurin family copper-binding protein [Gemmatimonadales bacterium]|nr:plastocyanin/azurin family copper-binding protein [Gemmatimonadales bacterium]